MSESAFGTGLFASGRGGRGPGRAARALALAALLLGCSRAPAPDADWPPGALVVARRQPVARILDALAALGEAPLARWAGRARRALPDCPLVAGRDPDGHLLAAFESLRCAAPDGPLAGLDAWRGASDAAFAWPAGGAQAPRALATLETTADGGVDLALRLPDEALRGAWRLLAPGGEPAGGGVLRSDGTLLHARARAGGALDLASLVDPGGQADRLFQLKSALFAGAVLDGSWEVALYPPRDGALMPRAAAALGFSQHAAAVAAMEAFVERLRAAWPVVRSDFALAGTEGACLQRLRLLPELLPCYVATDSALVVGWNPASLRAALADGGAPSHAATSPPPGRLVIDFERVAEADARLARRAGSGSRPPPRYPWRRLVAEGEAAPDGVRVRVRLHGHAPRDGGGEA